MLDVGSLFSGVGGFDLGLERAGMCVKWQCEQDDYCKRVLAKHWPGVPCYSDITKLRGSDVEYVDVLCGGFPCQDLSVAGKKAGLNGERSGLWFEYLRVIGEVRPRYVIVENVPALRKYLGTVLGGLSEAGYDTEWDCIRASDFGAPHQRNRLWLVAYTRRTSHVADAHGVGWRTREEASGYTGINGREPFDGSQLGRAGAMGHSDRTPENAHAAPGASRETASESGWWAIEPDVGRVAHGVPARVDRLRALGNALVPQIAEYIGRRIVYYEETHDN